MQGATENSEEACSSRKSTIQLSQWSPSNIYLYNKGGFFFFLPSVPWKWHLRHVHHWAAHLPEDRLLFSICGS